ncbi:HAD-IIA family hydrolase [Fodinicurvata sediminis]|uniref:HAD-IIA family hydrolase n=1 Tax=Fodinicurvata sediminis TaxID=1121832 RepID=UPI0003B74816|nr:HAD-IIA family hydrolase [Fodinicurvata sediminis]
MSEKSVREADIPHHEQRLGPEQRLGARIDLDRYRAFLCDLDGCLVSGQTVLPGARAFVDYAGERLHLFSNNSTDTPETLSERLRALDLAIPPERILLAGTASLDHLAETAPGAAVALYGTPALHRYAQARGLHLTDDRPSHVVLTRDPGFTYDDLNRIIRQLAQGAQLIVTNPDRTHPGADGLPVAETGALLAALRACQPKLTCQVIGKPEPLLYRIALDRLQLPARDILAIGDNPATDGLGARRAGMAVALVGKGDEEDIRRLGSLTSLTACV